MAFAALGRSTNIASVPAVGIAAAFAGTSKATIVGREDDRRQLIIGVVVPSAKEGMVIIGKKVPALTETGDAAC